MTIGRESYKRYRCALGALGMMTIFATANAMAGPQDFWSIGADGTTLVRIDKNTGAGTTIGTTGVATAYSAAFAPDGTLWTAFDPNNPRLGKIDLTTGAVTQVGSGLGGGGSISLFKGLEADNAGHLYGTGGDTSSFYEINTSTGVATALFPNRTAIRDIAFDNTTGTLWGLQFTGDLFTIDIANGTTSTIGKITGIPAFINSIGFDSAGQMFVVESVASNSKFYSVDTTTLAATSVGNTGLGWVNGGDFEFGPQGVPLPAPALLALVGFGCILIIRRRYFR